VDEPGRHQVRGAVAGRDLEGQVEDFLLPCRRGPDEALRFSPKPVESKGAYEAGPSPAGSQLGTTVGTR
jgi:hypothetical protein